MAEKKSSMGFETPSMRIQEAYKEILEQITTKKADWEKMVAKCNEEVKIVHDGTKNISESRS